MGTVFHPSTVTRKRVSYGLGLIVPTLIMGGSVWYSASKQSTWQEQIDSKNAVLERKDRELKATQDEIRDARRTLDDLTSKHRAFEAFIEDSPYPMAILRSDGVVIFWNKAAEKDTGYSFEEIKNRADGVLPIIPPEVQGQHSMLSAKALADDALVGKLKLVDCDRVNKAGKRRPVTVSVRVYKDSMYRYGMAQWLPRTRVSQVDVDDNGAAHVESRADRT